MEQFNSGNPNENDTSNSNFQQYEVSYQDEPVSPPIIDYSQPPKRRSEAGCIVGAMIATLAVVFFISLILVFMTPASDNPPADSSQVHSTPKSTNGNYTVATPIPVGTMRPMTTYDGVLPVISDTANPFPDIIDGVQNGVVSVNNYTVTTGLFSGKAQEQISGTGSGFIISSEGYVVTNAHVIDGAARVTIVLNDDSEVDVDVIGFDTSTDIAVLKFNPVGKHFSPLFLGDSSNVRVGEFVITIGDPSGRELAGTITFGIISAVDRTINIDGRTNTYLQTDAAMNPGNSGGPLINTRGEVIGLNSAKTVTASYDEYGNAISAEGLGFAIPMNTVKSIAESLITSGKIERPGIGVTVSAASEQELADLGYQYGIIVRSLIEGGPCDTAGMKEGDLIISCDDKEIKSNDDLTDVISKKKVGDKCSFVVVRNGKTQSITVTVGDLNNM